MTDTMHIGKLYEGVEAWNEWRRENPGERPILSGEDLSEMDLTGVNLSEADLSDAELFQADLSEANLKMAVLTRADLAGADLSGAALYKAELSDACLIEVDLTGASLGAAVLKGADLRGTKLRGVDCDGTDLSGANLSEADLTGANLSRADITGANLRNANLAGANLTAMKDGSFKEKRGRYYGIRGLDSCFGDPLFVRDAKDQDYLVVQRLELDRLRPQPRQAGPGCIRRGDVLRRHLPPRFGLRVALLRSAGGGQQPDLSLLLLDRHLHASRLGRYHAHPLDR
jgi:hypothetical protein